jgi:hypothetical protein
LSLDGGWERWVRRRRRDVVFVEVRRVSRQDVKWSWMDERMVCVVGVERNGRFEDRHGEWSWWGTWFVVEEGWGEDVSLTVVFCVIVDFQISWVRVSPGKHRSKKVHFWRVQLREEKIFPTTKTLQELRRGLRS